MIPYKSLLIKTAKKSTHRQHHMAALLMKGGRVVEVRPNNGHIHAEHAVINRSWRSNVKDMTMVVVRLRASGQFGMAKPCIICTERMIRAGIKKVIYTDINGDVKTMKLTDMGPTIPENMVDYEFVLSDKVTHAKCRYIKDNN